METSVNNGMCRCCASEGAFKDVKSTYHWMGEEEIYSDMLRDCFDINLEVSEQGQDGGICEVCITQLRNAINFKKQVLHTEEQFKIHLQNKTMFRPNIVKVELQAGEDSDDLGSGDDAFSGPEFEVPIKMETEETKPKKRGAKASATTTRAKKAKADNGETSNKRLGCHTEIKLQPNVSNMLKALKKPKSAKVENKSVDWTVTVSKKCKIGDKEVLLKDRILTMKVEDREIDKHLQNISTILLNSNATPIRKHTGTGYSCCFCSENFALPGDLKTHTLQLHDDKAKSNFMKGYPLTTYVVKLDITGLKCAICGLDIESLESVMDHLEKEHKKVIHRDINNHILPFKFDGDSLNCVLCPKSYERFKLLQEHMNVHYRNFICDICSSSFVNRRTLRGHLSRHKQGDFSCNFCPKIFDTQGKKLTHEKSVHIGDHRRNKCAHCGERFTGYAKKNEHMVEVHGAEPLVLKCLACDKTFSRRDRLSRHIKRDHLLERKHECLHCDMKFFGKKQLVMHMAKHTGAKPYKCDVCFKAYGRKTTLREHLRIHADDRRFKCDKCGQAFVQKCSWKNHMRSKHDVTV
nr:zinc finger protein 260 isoform X1 [Helicoverpa armigera]